MFILYTCTVSRAVKPVSVPCVHLYIHKLDLQTVCLMNISDNSKMKMIKSIVRECEDKFQIRWYSQNDFYDWHGYPF